MIRRIGGYLYRRRKYVLLCIAASFLQTLFMGPS
jgi:hypothetical protein